MKSLALALDTPGTANEAFCTHGGHISLPLWVATVQNSDLEFVRRNYYAVIIMHCVK